MEISLRPAAASKVNCDEKAAVVQTQGFFEEIVQQLKQLDAQPLTRGEKSSDEQAVDQDVFKAVGLIAIQLSEAEGEEDEPSVLYEHLAEMISSIPSSLDLEQPLLKLRQVLTDMQRAPVSPETDSQEQYLTSISTLLELCKNTSAVFQTEFAQLMEELQKPQLQSVKLSDLQLEGLRKTATEKIEKIHKQPRVLTDTLHEKRSADFFAVVQAAPKSSVRDMTAFHKEEKVPLLNQLPWKKDVVLRSESMDRDSLKKDSEISLTANTAEATLENNPSSFKSKEVPKVQEFSIDLRQVKSDHQPSDNLLNELQKIWSKASLSIDERTSKLSIKLLPKQLGTISIEVLQQKNEPITQVVVSSAKTKELLDANLSTLRQVLTSQYVSVDQVDVVAVQAAPESSVRDMNAFAKEEKVPQFSIDLGKVKLGHQQSSDLVNELQKIWSKASLSAEEGRSKLFVTLWPKQLGTISIEVLQQKNETTAQVVVSSAKTKELLDANLFRLRQALTSQHVSVDQVGVDAVHTASESSVRNMNAFRKEEKIPFFNQLPWKKDVVLHSESIDTNSSLKNSESSAGTNTTGATVENQPSSFGSGEMPKLQQFSIYLGQAKSDYQQSSNLVNELEKIWSKASISTEEGTSKLFIKLFPKQLGAISIEMLQKDSETVARIVVSSAKTKELLDANLSTLRHGLASQHVSIDKIDVLLSEQAVSYNNENDQQKERQEKEAFKKEEDQDSQQLEESASFLSSFETALINYNV
ncbi:flagellar hook-length control protein FliK [Priestia aryabhattai]|uniref:flagellar hook-length control protein FliK n=1 Tax=Priestia TaxID=2800373 RepID=UPI001EC30A13|nr:MULTISPECIES: flagellar hook-length control protein FliK [Priestia]MBY0092323.1 flagellar hook-length control protein FliK [Priestia aryabhattai]MBY0102766.1 flagellar hook-length control protein FliK [Priestia aryabhattai]MCM3304680.1 flagellar hook-length control protein FliK [Priestia megaterium]